MILLLNINLKAQTPVDTTSTPLQIILIETNKKRSPKKRKNQELLREKQAATKKRKGKVKQGSKN